MKTSFLLFAASLALWLPSTVMADQYTCAGFAGAGCAQATATNAASALTQIDHHDIYTWGFSGISIAGKTITSATIAFKAISNWDTNQNRLFIDLLDSPDSTALLSGKVGAVGTKLTNTNSGDVGITHWNDDFLHNNTNTAGANGGGDWRYSLTVDGSAAAGLVAVGASDSDHPNDIGHAGTVDSTHSFGGPSTSVDYTYTFTASQLATLATYITNGGDFAFGFSPDCHYYDSSVTFQFTTAPAAVPEPTSILLLATIAGFVIFQTRRTKRARA